MTSTQFHRVLASGAFMRSSLFVVAAFCLLTLAKPSHAEDPAARAKREAEAIFKILLPGEKPSACRLASDWDAYPVPRDLARGVFGVRVQADLAPVMAFWRLQEPKDIFPQQPPNVLCDEVERKAEWQRREAEYKTGSDQSMRNTHVQFTYPVFDETFRKAVVISTYSAIAFFRNEAGVHPGDLEVGVVAIILVRKGDGWHRIKKVTLEIS